jgi:hypothetical protein
MQRLFMTTYRYRDGLDEDDLRDLTKRFTEVGNAPGTIAHYARLDGRGGVVIHEDVGDSADTFETTLRYSPWIDFEVTPVTTIEEAFPVIQRVYG